MKNILKILVLVVLLPIVVFGQKKIPLEINNYKKLNSKFEMISVLNEDKNYTNSKSMKVVKVATFASLNSAEVQKILNNQYQTIEIQIPYKNELIAIELYRVNLFSENFTINTDKQKKISYSKGAYYRGIVKGNESSIASFNFFENEMNGIVSTLELGNLNIGKLLDSTSYIIYSDIDLVVKKEFICNTKDENIPLSTNSINNRNTQSDKCVTTYLEVGYQAYEANGYNLTTTTNWITSVFNNTQALFDNDGISIVLKTIFIWTQDDYYSYSSNYILPAFMNIRPEFDGDIGFIADIDPENLISQAFGIATLCSDRKYAYGNLELNFSNVPTYSWPLYVITHELGHSLGSHHTHACVWNGNNTAIDGCSTSYGGCTTPTYQPFGQGTIMSYCGANFALGFGSQPANAIIQHIDSSTCLGNDCISTCINTIGFINVTDVTQNSAIINWADINTSNSVWEISIVPSGNLPIWNAVTTNSHTIQNLIPNTYYEVTIRGNCSNGFTYPKHSIIFATQGDNCNGTIIYDTGGLTGGYQSEEHIIRTIVPTVPDKKIKLVFNTLNLIPWMGNLFIYDGMNTNGPLLNELTFGPPFLATGFGNSFEPFGNTFESQDPSGAITIEFFSRTIYSFETLPATAGWKATVSCLNSLGNGEFGDGFIDYSYSPNPVKNILNIKSKDVVESLSVYNVEGKLVSSSKPMSNDFKIDLSGLSNAIYTVNIIFNNSKASFKIIKE